MVAGGGAAKPPETQSIEMIRPRRASQNQSAGYLRHPSGSKNAGKRTRSVAALRDLRLPSAIPFGIRKMWVKARRRPPMQIRYALIEPIGVPSLRLIGRPIDVFNS